MILYFSRVSISLSAAPSPRPGKELKGILILPFSGKNALASDL